MTRDQMEELAKRLEAAHALLSELATAVGNSLTVDESVVMEAAAFIRSLLAQEPIGIVENLMLVGNSMIVSSQKLHAVAPGTELYASPVPAVEQHIGDSRCNYLMTADHICNKCGRIHDGKSVPAVDPDERQRILTPAFNPERKPWWFAIDRETLRLVEVAEGTPGAFAFDLRGGGVELSPERMAKLTRATAKLWDATPSLEQVVPIASTGRVETTRWC